jgi:hypothetical protein
MLQPAVALRVGVRGRIHTLALVTGFLLSCLAGTVCAEPTPSYDFHIAPQALATALVEFSKQADVQVVGATEAIGTLRTSGVVGRFTGQQALDRLLRDTSLSYRWNGERTVTITPGPVSRPTTSINLSDPSNTPSKLAQTQPAVPKQAAEAHQAPQAASLEEVVVSATRLGEQSVQKVAMAISVLSPTDLDAKGLGGVSDFVNTLPSVNMQSQSPGVNSIEMRGLVTQFPDITLLQDRSLTSMYLDDAPISIQTANPDLKVFDLERIEVIRGPQGTLFGAGSMAGTIRLITRKPDSQEFFGSGDMSVSETQHGGTNYSIRGAVNLPITENVLAVRLNAYRGEDSGFIDNIQLDTHGETHH